MDKQQIVKSLAEKIRSEFFGESTGHDWYHIERVWKNAQLIAIEESCDAFVVQLGALLHDIADHKFVEDAENVAQQRTRDLLSELAVNENDIQAVQHIVANCSYSKTIGGNPMQTIEGLIVQDADKLDAIGAVGIARTFAYGAKHGNMIYDPEINPEEFESKEAYRSSRTHTINHFYEKLLKLKDQMNTDSGKRIAENRHFFMEKFLDQFYAEWQGKS